MYVRIDTVTSCHHRPSKTYKLNTYVVLFNTRVGKTMNTRTYSGPSKLTPYGTLPITSPLTYVASAYHVSFSISIYFPRETFNCLQDISRLMLLQRMSLTNFTSANGIKTQDNNNNNQKIDYSSHFRILSVVQTRAFRV